MVRSPTLMEVEAFDAAERWIGNALGQDGTDPELEAKLNMLPGECSMAQDDPASAAAAFQQADDLGVDSPRMSYWGALAHVETGDLIGAERNLDEAVAR